MSITVSIDGTDKSDVVRFTEWDLTEYAFRGQVGAGVLVMDDPTGSYLPPAQKAVLVTSIYAGSNSRLFTGYVAERSAERGRSAPGGREWSVTVEDINARLDDRIITDAMQGSTKRAAETDYARITWLLSTGAMTGITVGSSGSNLFVPNANKVDMDAVDYRGKSPREVLEDCAQASGKNFFLFDEGAGTRLFYATSTNPIYSSTATISDTAASVNGTSVFGAYNVRFTLDPSRVYSRVRVRYKGGALTTTENATTAATYRVREKFKRYMRAKTATKAQALADRWLSNAAAERTTLSCSIDISTQYVPLIRPGHRILVQLSRYDINAYYRIIRRSIRQVTDDVIALDLEFEDDVRPTAFMGGPVDNADGEETSNGTDTSSSVVLDSDGITVTGGSISVTNSSGTVIIDGSTDLFSIVATGTLTIPRSELKGTQYQSVTVTTGVGFDPASLFFAKTGSKEGKGDWAQPLPELALSASGTVLRMVGGRARYVQGTSPARTQVQVYRFTSSPPEAAVTVRYYILQKTSI